MNEDGTIRGHYTDGTMRDLGKISLARFANSRGLVRRGRNQYSEGNNSGLPVQADPGLTRIRAGARELSNTDIGRELIEIDKLSTMFRANVRVLQAGDEMLDELSNLLRPR